MARSMSTPVVIFKHSPTCGVSAQAEESLLELLADPPVAADWCLVPVPASRQVSNEIAARFGIRHESPQAFIIHNGRVVWHGSHHRVTGSGLKEALDVLPPSAF